MKLNMFLFKFISYICCIRDTSFSAEPSLLLNSGDGERMTHDIRFAARPYYTRRVEEIQEMSHSEDVCARIPARKNTSTAELKRKRYFWRTNEENMMVCLLTGVPV